MIARSGFQCIKMSFRLNNFKFPSQSCCKRNLVFLDSRKLLRHPKLQHFYSPELLSHPKVQHFFLLSKFVALSVVLLSVDIATDINTAVDFFSRGDIYWAIFTLIPICAPFLARMLLLFTGLCRCFKADPNGCGLTTNRARLAFWRQDLMKQLPWNFPLIQPIR